MILVVILVLYAIGSVLEAFEEISMVLSPFLTSSIGTVLTVIVTAFITYRWYRTRRSVERGSWKCLSIELRSMLSVKPKKK